MVKVYRNGWWLSSPSLTDNVEVNADTRYIRNSESDGLLTWQVEIEHAGLHKYRVVKGQTRERLSSCLPRCSCVHGTSNGNEPRQLYAQHGIPIRRPLTDNASCYGSRH